MRLLPAVVMSVVLLLVGCGIMLPKPPPPPKHVMHKPPAELTHCPGKTGTVRPLPRIRTPEELAAYGTEAEALRAEAERRRAVCESKLTQLADWITAELSAAQEP
jgi:hypothetical protein